MNNWLALGIIAIVLIILIGNFSTVRRNAKTPLRKKSLNDLQETLPRTNKTSHQMPSIPQNQPHSDANKTSKQEQ
ncbi:hypothetical protein SG34_012605 [Thalassomonas viridans]|uniref:Uncharacterized protein n=1 Tax=Thalassomonas viridans TaxID=137584 RepID=A0AAE9Z7X9_9GAMM|nr:hypothetical protein [Thalassomonas viridans]WDE07654.1 hypothetical protein SG34_012605 [Thalassomonas viridans]